MSVLFWSDKGRECCYNKLTPNCASRANKSFQTCFADKQFSQRWRLCIAFVINVQENYLFIAFHQTVFYWISQKRETWIYIRFNFHEAKQTYPILAWRTFDWMLFFLHGITISIDFEFHCVMKSQEASATLLLRTVVDHGASWMLTRS